MTIKLLAFAIVTASLWTAPGVSAAGCFGEVGCLVQLFPNGIADGFRNWIDWKRWNALDDRSQEISKDYAKALKEASEGFIKSLDPSSVTTFQANERVIIAATHGGDSVDPDEVCLRRPSESVCYWTSRAVVVPTR
jgi:hypothetical protein